MLLRGGSGRDFNLEDRALCGIFRAVKDGTVERLVSRLPSRRRVWIWVMRLRSSKERTVASS